MAESACPDCGGKIGIKATRCRCGWKMPGSAQQNETPRRPHIQCCVEGCPNSANVRVWTKTGWANVCARVNASDIGTFHYEQIQQVPRVTHNPYLDALRAARRNGPKNIPEAIGNIIPREPGADDDLPLRIGRDPLEEEFADRANP